MPCAHAPMQMEATASKAFLWVVGTAVGGALGYIVSQIYGIGLSYLTFTLYMACLISLPPYTWLVLSHFHLIHGFYCKVKSASNDVSSYCKGVRIRHVQRIPNLQWISSRGDCNCLPCVVSVCFKNECSMLNVVVIMSYHLLWPPLPVRMKAMGSKGGSDCQVLLGWAQPYYTNGSNAP